MLLSLVLSAGGEEVLPGHSHQGQAFNEGPRQEAVLMVGTGEVDFPVTCRWEQGQAFFNQGVGQLHGFWYYEAERTFRQIAAHDPDCAMAYWGMALANWENPKRAKGFIEKAVEKSELEGRALKRERMYIAAAADFFDEEPKDLKKRGLELIKDLEAIIHAYPDDIEAKALLALRMWQFSGKGLPITSHEAVDALLQQVFAQSPQHPAHHFRIHLWDKVKAERAVDSAALLGPSAPAIAHMWHMPGHIYVKLHRYHDAAWQQEASARVDHAEMGRSYLIPDQIHNYAHNNEWLARNWVCLGKGRAALAMAKSLLANPRHPKWNTLGGKAHSYRYGRERLVEVLEKFELWEEARDLAGTPWLELTDDREQDGKRWRLLALAAWALEDATALQEAEGQLAKLVTAAEAEEAEFEGGKEEKEKKKAETAKKKREALAKSLAEVRGLQAAAEGKTEEALAAVEKGSRPLWSQALFALDLGETEKADELSRKALEKGKGEVLPLAARIEVLARRDAMDEAQKLFETLRPLAAEADLDLRPLARLAPIARQLSYPDDWRLPWPVADDLGERPALDTLGPVHWEPKKAAALAHVDEEGQMRGLADYEGKPVVLVFYLGFGCLHCAEQLNALAARVEDFQAAGLPVLAVSTDSPEKLRKSHENYEADGARFPFHLVANPDLGSFRAYGCYDDFEKKALHGTFLVGPKGRVLWSDVSAEPFMDMDFLLSEFPRLLKLRE
ncbi:MAG: peroxiredoxin family protein [Verrucomicrobiales bacterium]